MGGCHIGTDERRRHLSKKREKGGERDGDRDQQMEERKEGRQEEEKRRKEARFFRIIERSSAFYWLLNSHKAHYLVCWFL